MLSICEKKRKKDMKCLEELEGKVLHLIQNNAELKTRIDELIRENENLNGRVHQFEESLLREQKAFATLEDEKLAIRNVVEGLLNTINTLESSSN